MLAGRLVTAALRLVLLAALAAAALIALRAPLAEAVLREQLARNGLGDARLRVVEIGLRQTVLADLAIGDGPGAVRAAQLRLGYHRASLMAGRLEALTLEGLRLPVSAIPKLRQRFSALSGPADGADEAPTAALTGALALRDARLILNGTPAGIDGAPLGALLTALGPGEVRLDGDVALAGEAPVVALTAKGRSEGAQLALTLRSDGLGPGGRIAIDAALDADLAALAPGAALPGAVPRSGRAEIALDGYATLPEEHALQPEAWIAAGARVEGRLAARRLPIGADGARATGALAFRLTGGAEGLWLDLPAPARMQVAGAAAFLPAGLSLGENAVLGLSLPAGDGALVWAPDEAGGVLRLQTGAALAFGAAEARLSLALDARHDARFSLAAPAALAGELEVRGLALEAPEGSARLEALDWAVEGSLAPDGGLALGGEALLEAVEIAVAGIAARRMALAGQLGVARSGDRWRVETQSGLELTAAGLAVEGGLRLDGETVVLVETAALERSPAGLAVRLDAALDGLAGRLADGTSFSRGEGRLRLETEADGQGLLRLDAGALRLPGAAVSITGFGLSLPLGAAPGPRPARLAANLRDRRREGRFAPLKLALEGARDGEALSLSGTIGPRDGSATLPLRIDADLAAQSGRLDLGPSRLSFRRGRLQPAALSPALALLEAVTGGVRLSASGQRDAAGKLASGLSLELDGLTASAGDMAFEGLSGRVALDSLAPLRMRRAQSFKARRLVAGIPLEAARWDLRLARAGRVLELRDFRASLAGGEIALEALDWDTAAREHAFEIEIRDVSLERLLSDWQIAGITGTGRISGRLPVRLGPAGAGLADGRLAAGGPGVVRVDWGPARERLVGSSQQMALVVEALEDFRYETLSVGVSQEPGGELQLAIGLSGANPAVLDGYPFQFNIALSGALDPILQAVREGGRIGGNLLQGGFGLGN